MNCCKVYNRRCMKCGTLWTLQNIKLRDLAEWYKSFCQYCGGEREETE